MKKISRRQFLIGTAVTGATLALHRWLTNPAEAKRALAPRAAAANRVVHVHDSSATTWDYSTGWYGNYVDQSVVNTMTDRGVMALTGTSTRADAWHVILPSYVAGQKVAIKVNLNNAACTDSDNIIDALPQPVNAIILGLTSIGVAQSDIYIYDVTHADVGHTGEMPARFGAKITPLYSSVRFDPLVGNCSVTPSYSSTQKIHFNVPTGKPAISDRPICTTLVNATYLINMPIMKRHGFSGVTLGFKNHFGSFDQCGDLHWSIQLTNPSYVSTYSAMVDILNNAHFYPKTVLTVGDGLYGDYVSNGDIPVRWSTFNNQSPNSLFFSRDPVAIDCVMYDHLNAQSTVPTKADDYLKLANTSGLGTFEHWNAQHSYSLIDYQRLEPGSELATATATRTPTATATKTGTRTPTATATKTATRTPTVTKTKTRTPTASATLPENLTPESYLPFISNEP